MATGHAFACVTLSRFNSRRSEKRPVLVFFFIFFFFSHRVPFFFFYVLLERKRTEARIMGREGTTLGFYSWGIKYEQSVREVKPYFLFENQCRIRERNDDNWHSRSLFQSHRYFSVTFFFFFFWFARRVSYCVYKSLLACVYNGVLCTCEYNNHINESIAASSSWLIRDKWLKIITHILSDENKKRNPIRRFSVAKPYMHTESNARVHVRRK